MSAQPKPFPVSDQTAGQLRAQLDLTRAELAVVREHRRTLRATLQHLHALAIIESQESKVWARTVGRIENALESTQ